MIDSLLRGSGVLSSQTVVTSDVDSAAVKVAVLMDKTTWVSLTAKCNALIEISLNGGQSFTSLGGFTNEAGGIGSQVLETRRIPAEQGVARRARFTFTPSAPFITTITMRTFDGTEPRELAGALAVGR